ncbi:hypothetical protein [Psychromonas sp. GE-S-Ul-11]|uniref:copper-resistant cuproprotein CopI n=1 Tax=Psychromonas sp. GE-S-Ul-11 TaxID=3241170 RepID=UPI00390C5E38
MNKTLNRISTILSLSILLSAPFSVAADQTVAKMDHATMTEEMMDHSSMKTDNMHEIAMDHSHMSMPGMSDVGMLATGAKPNKVVYVMLSDDMKITFKKEVKIEPNDVVQFVVMNTGKMNHEFMIGSAQEQFEHREMMTKMNHDKHESDNSITVKPGEAGQIMWHFHGEKNVELACNIAGHFEAGMVKKLIL